MDARIAADDAIYLQTLLEKQTTRKAFGAPVHLEDFFRNSIVKLLRKISIDLELGNAVLHTAVWLFDCLSTGSIKINLKGLKPVAFACLFIAAKLMLTRTTAPSYLTFCEVGRVEILKQSHLLHIELLIMNNVKWDVMVPTVVTFIEFYKNLPIIYDADCPTEVDTSVRIRIDSYLEKCQWVILQDVDLCLMTPSLLALGSIMASRRMLGMHHFPDQLIETSPHTYNEIIAASLKVSINQFAAMGFTYGQKNDSRTY